MTSIESVTLEVPDPGAAERFYTAAFGLGTQLRVRASEEPTTGFRGFTLSLVVSQPATVQALIGAALDAGATAAEARQEVVLGLRRRRPSAGRDDLEGRDFIEEGHRPRRLGRSTTRCSCWESRTLPRANGSTSTAACRSRGALAASTSSSPPRVARQAGALRPPCPGQGRRRLPGRHRIAPDHHCRRCRPVHRPGRVRVGGRGSPQRTAPSAVRQAT